MRFFNIFFNFFPLISLLYSGFSWGRKIDFTNYNAYKSIQKENCSYLGNSYLIRGTHHDKTINGIRCKSEDWAFHLCQLVNSLKVSYDMRGCANIRLVFLELSALWNYRFVKVMAWRTRGAIIEQRLIVRMRLKSGQVNDPLTNMKYVTWKELSSLWVCASRRNGDTWIEMFPFE